MHTCMHTRPSEGAGEETGRYRVDTCTLLTPVHVCVTSHENVYVPVTGRIARGYNSCVAHNRESFGGTEGKPRGIYAERYCPDKAIAVLHVRAIRRYSDINNYLPVSIPTSTCPTPLRRTRSPPVRKKASASGNGWNARLDHSPWRIRRRRGRKWRGSCGVIGMPTRTRARVPEKRFRGVIYNCHGDRIFRLVVMCCNTMTDHGIVQKKTSACNVENLFEWLLKEREYN